MAIKGGQLTVLKFFLEREPSEAYLALQRGASWGALWAIQYVYMNYFESFDKDFQLKHVTGILACEGNIEGLSWMHSVHPLAFVHATLDLAYLGSHQLKTAQHLHSLQPELFDLETIGLEAAQFGHMDVVRWADQELRRAGQ